jgi:hypothetical protein
MKNEEFHRLAEEVLEGLRGRLPEENIANAEEEFEAGELILFLEGLVYQLVHHDVPISREEGDKIRELMLSFSLPVRNVFDIMNNREVWLDRLNVVDSPGGART